MKFFIDTANLDEIREANEMGVLDGVTTNPTHISKEEGTFEEIILRICEVVDGPVSAEVISTEWEAMVEEARRVSGIHEQVVVKIPITLDGLKAVKACFGEDIRTNVTLCFSPNQALLAPWKIPPGSPPCWTNRCGCAPRSPCWISARNGRSDRATSSLNPPIHHLNSSA